MEKIKIAETDAQIIFCFDVIRELRPHLKEEEFLDKVRRMQQEGFMLAYIEENTKAIAAAGFRINEMLHRGRSVYVDDLVTLPEYRSKNYGGKLLDWIIRFAKENNCEQV